MNVFLINDSFKSVSSNETKSFIRRELWFHAVETFCFTA